MTVPREIRTLVLVLFLFSVVCRAQLDDRLCNGPDCKEPISIARPLLAYSKSTDDGVSFLSNDRIYIISKPAFDDNKTGMYEVEVFDSTGKKFKSKGFAPRNLLREEKILVKKEKLTRVKRFQTVTEKPVVDTFSNHVAGGVNAELGDGGPPSTPYEVVEGTTVYMGMDGEATIASTATQPPSLHTETLASSPPPSLPSAQPEKPVEIVHSNVNEPAASEKTERPFVPQPEIILEKSAEAVAEKQSLELKKPIVGNEIEEEEDDNDDLDEEDDGGTEEDEEEEETSQENGLKVAPTASAFQEAKIGESMEDVIPLTPKEVELVNKEHLNDVPLTPSLDLEKPVDAFPSNEADTDSSKTIPETVEASTAEGSPSLPEPASSERISGEDDSLDSPTPTSPEPDLFQETQFNVSDTLSHNLEETASAITTPVEETLELGDFTPPEKLPVAAGVPSEEIDVLLDKDQSSKSHDVSAPSDIPVVDSSSPSSAPPSLRLDDSLLYNAINSDPAPIQDVPPTQRPIYPGLFPNTFKEVKTEPVAQTSSETSLEDTTTPESSLPTSTEVPVLETEEKISGVGSLEPILPQSESLPVETDVGETSGILENFMNFFSGFWSEVKVNDPDIVIENEANEKDGIYVSGECKAGKILESDCLNEPSPPHLWQKIVPETSYTLLYLIVTSVTLLIFTLGYYFIEGSNKNGPLIAKINQLNHDLQIATSQLESRAFQDSTNDMNQGLLASMQQELNKVKKQNEKLQSQVDALQQELDSSTDTGMELNKMVTDLLAEKEAASSLLKSVEQLQGQLNSQQRVIDEMTISLQEKINENTILQNELASVQEKAESFEEELNSVRENLALHIKERENATWELESKLDQLETEKSELLLQIHSLNEKKASEIAVLSQSVSELKEQLSLKDSEFKALSETIEYLKKGGIDAKEAYDVGHLRAELARLLTEKDSLQERLNDEIGARKLLEDHVHSVDLEVAQLRKSYENAEREKIEAETKLGVLSNYWKEKETHLQKELGLQEAMWAQKQGEASSTYERIKSLQDEVESYNFDSFGDSNEGLSFTNSLSSVEPVSSSVSKQNEFASSPEPISLPPTPKPRHIVRRRSSASFEARLERAEHMIKTLGTVSRSVPEDLLKLQKLKTVRASPFRETSPEPEISPHLQNGFPSEPFSFLQGVSHRGIPYNALSSTVPPPTIVDLPLIPVNHNDKSDTDDSSNTNCNVSSATLEFDIKVVANASSNVKKFKMKPLGPRNGSQNEILKKEIVDQERGLKNQIAALEKKAHENWVAARQAERRLDESKQEAGQLRNMLTLKENKTTDGANLSSPRELNGEDVPHPLLLPDGTSPLPLPPLPLDPLVGPPPMLPPNFMPPFMPPPLIPPPPLHPGDRRLPPLGRMSSPPLNRFSPEPGDYGYDRMSPVLSPPPPRSYRSPHRSSPWNEAPPRSGFRPVASHRRGYEGSFPSSGHSSEESLEKNPPIKKRTSVNLLQDE